MEWTIIINDEKEYGKSLIIVNSYAQTCAFYADNPKHEYEKELAKVLLPVIEELTKQNF